MVSARIVTDASGVIEDVAVSVGSCSLVATRLPDLEKVLIGRNIKDQLQVCITDECLSILSPIDDVRATKAYRMDASKELVARALYMAGEEFC